MIIYSELKNVYCIASTGQSLMISVVDRLLTDTKNIIQCYIQKFPDDLSLKATLKSLSAKRKGEFDADTLREIMQKSLNFVKRNAIVQREW